MNKTRTIPSASAGVEYRTAQLGDVDSDADELTGLAVRFDSPTQIGAPGWGFRERFAPGAFSKTLQERDVVLLDNHDASKPVARKSAGTLNLSQSDGLRWSAVPADTSYARDMRANIRAKNYGGCSFGFQAVKEDWLDDAGNPSNSAAGTQRVVREAKLFEVSVCTFPAYGDTEVSARSAVSAAREPRAALATYSDVDTCAECGATSQYGAYCSGCGEAMTPPAPAKAFCSSCGSALSGDRAEHACSATPEDSAANSTEPRGDSGSDASIPKPDDSTLGNSENDPRILMFRLLELKR